MLKNLAYHMDITGGEVYRIRHNGTIRLMSLDEYNSKNHSDDEILNGPFEVYLTFDNEFYFTRFVDKTMFAHPNGSGFKFYGYF